MTKPIPHSRTIKAHCELCSHYRMCPRMQGKNICYGKQEVLSENPITSPQSDYIIEHTIEEQEHSHGPQS